MSGFAVSRLFEMQKVCQIYCNYVDKYLSIFVPEGKAVSRTDPEELLDMPVCEVRQKCAVEHIKSRAAKVGEFTRQAIRIAPDDILWFFTTLLAEHESVADKLARLTLFILLLSCCQPAASGEKDNIPAASEYAKIAEQLAGIIRVQVEEKQIPAFSIALVDDQRIVWAQGFGQADSENNVPATAKTVYRVGSVSKLFTDIAIMQLVEQDAVDLDAPVTKYIPDFQPANSFDKQITLRQLTSHRAGLVRETPVGHYFDPTEPSLLETVRSLNQTAIVYEPETKIKYSNAGVSVVGYALERISGQPFETAIDRSVLQTLGMTNSSFDLDDRTRPYLAKAIMWTYDGRVMPAPEFKLGIAPAGNLYSNVIDLGKFAAAIFNGGQGENGRLLKAETIAEMMSPQFGGGNDSFGIGFHVSDFAGHKMVGHGGAVYGFSTQFQALPDKKIAVIAAASKDVCNGTVRRIVDHGLKCMLAQQAGAALPEFEIAGPVDPNRARLLDGLYVDEAAKQTRELVERNGRLFISGGELIRELRAQKDNLVVDDAFGFGPKVNATDSDSFTIDTNTYHRVDHKLPNAVPPQWAGLVGEYGWDHNTMYVYENRGQLWCLIEWFFHYPLKQIDEDTYEFPDYGLYHGERLSFQRDSAGVATQVNTAKIDFLRRVVGTAEGETFKITPVKPIDEIRKIALDAQPPASLVEGFLDPDLIELIKLDDTIKLDIRYASTNNFMGVVFYKQPRAFLQRPAAEALVRAHLKLKEKGYGLLIHDAYRPWYVTKMFWEATPAEQKIFVANPANGSRHNRGSAVDLTLYDLKSGKPIAMGAGYDEFSPRSFPDYPVTDSRARFHRELLRDAMETEGFTIYEFEWWHFDYRDWEKYPVLNLRFEELN